MPRLDYGKYRGIVISIALFLLLDASVLIMNFYISFEIAEDAVAVNLAGRQRMLSQRMTKALLDSHYAEEQPPQLAQALDELRVTRDLFDTTLTAFQHGGSTRGADQSAVQLPAVNDADALAAIASAEQLWRPYREHIDRLLASNDGGSEVLFAASLHNAIGYARANNLALLKSMNDFTVRLEQLATAKATRLRMIQTVGISLAVCNFIFIILHFIAQLREGDRRIELARRETTEILATVNEGLFLLDRDLSIGSQHSTKLVDIFGDRPIAGRSLEELLGELISGKDMETTRDFVGLLFNDKIKEKLIGDLNPLDRVQIHLPDGSGGFISKTISFQFARAYEDGEIANVLVTVNDITEQVRLEQELEASRGESEQQLAILTNILHADPALLRMFINGAHNCYERINTVLREPARETAQLRHKIQRIFGDIHNLKGEAGALSLDNFEDLAHRFEEELGKLREKSDLSGNDFLPLTVRLDRLISYTHTVEKLIDRLGGLADISAERGATPSWIHLHELSDRVARRSGKQVQLVTSGLGELSLSPARFELINQLCIQFLRNAVVHGIEAPADRLDASKPECGRVDIRLAELDGGQLELTVRDDGDGFDYDAIRSQALQLGKYSEQQLECMNNRQLLSLIFEPGFSTAGEVSEDAGRGVGMDVILSKINASGGRLRVASNRGRYCRFVVTLPAETALMTSAA